jgi:hypothetical protein
VLVLVLYPINQHAGKSLGVKFSDSASETILNAELTDCGLQAVALTPESYAAVLTELLKAMDADSVYNTAYNKALNEVTAQVEALADTILYRIY